MHAFADDHAADGEPQPGALHLGLVVHRVRGRHARERLEERLLRHAAQTRPGVGDGDVEPTLTSRSHRWTHRQLDAPRAGGLAGVAQGVADALNDAHDVDIDDLGQPSLEGDHDGDPGESSHLHDRAVDEAHETRRSHRQLDLARAQLAQLQQVIADADDLVGALCDAPHVLAVLRRDGVVSAELEDLAAADDAVDRVAKLVRQVVHDGLLRRGLLLRVHASQDERALHQVCDTAPEVLVPNHEEGDPDGHAQPQQAVGDVFAERHGAPRDQVQNEVDGGAHPHVVPVAGANHHEEHHLVHDPHHRPPRAGVRLEHVAVPDAEIGFGGAENLAPRRRPHELHGRQRAQHQRPRAVPLRTGLAGVHRDRDVHCHDAPCGHVQKRLPR
mmetsp:Transcript_6345/g.22623  ORF Transcript_6345/g.22623 Transcript_6345/m.22623 type:complete len:386 (+) Transcript_6345:615-1772(+)